MLASRVVSTRSQGLLERSPGGKALGARRGFGLLPTTWATSGFQALLVPPVRGNYVAITHFWRHNSLSSELRLGPGVELRTVAKLAIERVDVTLCRGARFSSMVRMLCCTMLSYRLQH
jgi:hypothetical protein